MKTLFCALLFVAAVGCHQKNQPYPASPTAPSAPLPMEQTASVLLSETPDAGMPEPPVPPNDGPLPPL
jgi:hypothetical protein